MQQSPFPDLGQIPSIEDLQALASRSPFSGVQGSIGSQIQRTQLAPVTLSAEDPTQYQVRPGHLLTDEEAQFLAEKMGPKGFRETMRDEWTTSQGLWAKAPFVGMAPEFKHLLDIHAAVRRLKAGEYDDPTQRAADEQALIDYTNSMLVETARGETFWGKVAGIGSRMPTYVIELAATKGIYTKVKLAALAKMGAIKASTKKHAFTVATRYARRTARQLAEKQTQGLLRNVGKDFIENQTKAHFNAAYQGVIKKALTREAEKLTVKGMLAAIPAIGARAQVMGTVSTLVNSLDAMVPFVSRDEEGVLKLGESPSFREAYIRHSVLNYIEIANQHLGFAISPGYEKLVKGVFAPILSKTFNKTLGPMIAGLTGTPGQKVAKAVTSNAFRARLAQGAAMFNAMQYNAAIQDAPVEFVEEWTTMISRALAGVDVDPRVPIERRDPWAKRVMDAVMFPVKDPHTAAAMFTAFHIMPAVMRTTGVVMGERSPLAAQQNAKLFDLQEANDAKTVMLGEKILTSRTETIMDTFLREPTETWPMAVLRSIGYKTKADKNGKVRLTKPPRYSIGWYLENYVDATQIQDARNAIKAGEGAPAGSEAQVAATAAVKNLKTNIRLALEAHNNAVFMNTAMAALVNNSSAEFDPEVRATLNNIMDYADVRHLVVRGQARAGVATPTVLLMEANKAHDLVKLDNRLATMRAESAADKAAGLPDRHAGEFAAERQALETALGKTREELDFYGEFKQAIGKLYLGMTLEVDDRIKSPQQLTDVQSQAAFRRLSEIENQVKTTLGADFGKRGLHAVANTMRELGYNTDTIMAINNARQLARDYGISLDVQLRPSIMVYMDEKYAQAANPGAKVTQGWTDGARWVDKETGTHIISLDRSATPETVVHELSEAVFVDNPNNIKHFVEALPDMLVAGLDISLESPGDLGRNMAVWHKSVSDILANYRNNPNDETAIQSIIEVHTRFALGWMGVDVDADKNPYAARMAAGFRRAGARVASDVRTKYLDKAAKVAALVNNPVFSQRARTEAEKAKKEEALLKVKTDAQKVSEAEAQKHDAVAQEKRAAFEQLRTENEMLKKQLAEVKPGTPNAVAMEQAQQAIQAAAQRLVGEQQQQSESIRLVNDARQDQVARDRAIQQQRQLLDDIDFNADDSPPTSSDPTGVGSTSMIEPPTAHIFPSQAKDRFAGVRVADSPEVLRKQMIRTALEWLTNGASSRHPFTPLDQTTLMRYTAGVEVLPAEARFEAMAQKFEEAMGTYLDNPEAAILELGDGMAALCAKSTRALSGIARKALAAQSRGKKIVMHPDLLAKFHADLDPRIRSTDTESDKKFEDVSDPAELESLAQDTSNPFMPKPHDIDGPQAAGIKGLVEHAAGGRLPVDVTTMRVLSNAILKAAENGVNIGDDMQAEALAADFYGTLHSVAVQQGRTGFPEYVKKQTPYDLRKALVAWRALSAEARSEYWKLFREEHTQDINVLNIRYVDNNHSSFSTASKNTNLSHLMGAMRDSVDKFLKGKKGLLLSPEQIKLRLSVPAQLPILFAWIDPALGLYAKDPSNWPSNKRTLVANDISQKIKPGMNRSQIRDMMLSRMEPMLRDFLNHTPLGDIHASFLTAITPSGSKAPAVENAGSLRNNRLKDLYRVMPAAVDAEGKTVGERYMVMPTVSGHGLRISKPPKIAAIAGIYSAQDQTGVRGLDYKTQNYDTVVPRILDAAAWQMFHSAPRTGFCVLPPDGGTWGVVYDLPNMPLNDATWQDAFLPWYKANIENFDADKNFKVISAEALSEMRDTWKAKLDTAAADLAKLPEGSAERTAVKNDRLNMPVALKEEAKLSQAFYMPIMMNHFHGNIKAYGDLGKFLHRTKSMSGGGISVFPATTILKSVVVQDMKQKVFFFDDKGQKVWRDNWDAFDGSLWAEEEMFAAMADRMGIALSQVQEFKNRTDAKPLITHIDVDGYGIIHKVGMYNLTLVRQLAEKYPNSPAARFIARVDATHSIEQDRPHTYFVFKSGEKLSPPDSASRVNAFDGDGAFTVTHRLPGSAFKIQNDPAKPAKAKAGITVPKQSGVPYNKMSAAYAAAKRMLQRGAIRPPANNVISAALEARRVLQQDPQNTRRPAHVVPSALADSRINIVPGDSTVIVNGLRATGYGTKAPLNPDMVGLRTATKFKFNPVNGEYVADDNGSSVSTSEGIVASGMFKSHPRTKESHSSANRLEALVSAGLHCLRGLSDHTTNDMLEPGIAGKVAISAIQAEVDAAKSLRDKAVVLDKYFVLQDLRMKQTPNGFEYRLPELPQWGGTVPYSGPGSVHTFRPVDTLKSDTAFFMLPGNDVFVAGKDFDIDAPTFLQLRLGDNGAIITEGPDGEYNADLITLMREHQDAANFATLHQLISPEGMTALAGKSDINVPTLNSTEGLVWLYNEYGRGDHLLSMSAKEMRTVIEGRDAVVRADLGKYADTSAKDDTAAQLHAITKALDITDGHKIPPALVPILDQCVNIGADHLKEFGTLIRLHLDSESFPLAMAALALNGDLNTRAEAEAYLREKVIPLLSSGDMQALLKIEKANKDRVTNPKPVELPTDNPQYYTHDILRRTADSLFTLGRVLDAHATPMDNGADVVAMDQLRVKSRPAIGIDRRAVINDVDNNLAYQNSKRVQIDHNLSRFPDGTETGMAKLKAWYDNADDSAKSRFLRSARSRAALVENMRINANIAAMLRDPVWSQGLDVQAWAEKRMSPAGFRAGLIKSLLEVEGNAFLNAVVMNPGTDIHVMPAYYAEAGSAQAQVYKDAFAELSLEHKNGLIFNAFLDHKLSESYMGSSILPYVDDATWASLSQLMLADQKAWQGSQVANLNYFADSQTFTTEAAQQFTHTIPPEVKTKALRTAVNDISAQNKNQADVAGKIEANVKIMETDEAAVKRLRDTGVADAVRQPPAQHNPEWDSDTNKGKRGYSEYRVSHGTVDGLRQYAIVYGKPVSLKNAAEDDFVVVQTSPQRGYSIIHRPSGLSMVTAEAGGKTIKGAVEAAESRLARLTPQQQAEAFAKAPSIYDVEATAQPVADTQASDLPPDPKHISTTSMLAGLESTTDVQAMMENALREPMLRGRAPGLQQMMSRSAGIARAATGKTIEDFTAMVKALTKAKRGTQTDRLTKDVQLLGNAMYHVTEIGARYLSENNQPITKENILKWAKDNPGVRAFLGTEAKPLGKKGHQPAAADSQSVYDVLTAWDRQTAEGRRGDWFEAYTSLRNMMHEQFLSVISLGYMLKNYDVMSDILPSDDSLLTAVKRLFPEGSDVVTTFEHAVDPKTGKTNFSIIPQQIMNAFVMRYMDFFLPRPISARMRRRIAKRPALRETPRSGRIYQSMAAGVDRGVEYNSYSAFDNVAQYLNEMGHVMEVQNELSVMTGIADGGGNPHLLLIRRSADRQLFTSGLRPDIIKANIKQLQNLYKATAMDGNGNLKQGWSPAPINFKLDPIDDAWTQMETLVGLIESQPANPMRLETFMKNAGYLKIDATQEAGIAASEVYVQPGIAESMLKHITSRGLYDIKSDVVRKSLQFIKTLNQFTKSIAVSSSLFFHVALTESATSGLGPKHWADFRQHWRAAQQIRKMDPTTMAEWRRANLMDPADMPADYRSAPLDKTMGNAIKWAQRTPGLSLTLAPALRGMMRFKQTFDHVLWNELQPTYKIMVAEQLLAEARADYGLYGISDNVLREDIAKHVNNMFGKQNWLDYAWANPLTLELLNLSMFAPDWTISAINMAGLGDAVTALTGSPSFLSQNFTTPIRQKNLTSRYWPTFISVWMVGIPSLIQAIVHVWDQALPDPDPDHELWMLFNPDEPFRMDLTPIFRRLGKGYGITNRRRVFMQFGKQGMENIRWITGFKDALMAKSSMPIKLALEQLFSKNSAWHDMPWAQEFGAAPQPMGGWFEVNGKWIDSRSAGLLRYAMPMWMGTWLYSNQPPSMLAPLKLGISKTAAVGEITQVLDAYADKEFYDRHVAGYPKAVRKLEELVPNIITRLKINGYNDTDDVMKTAVARLRAKYNTQYFDELNRRGGPRDAEISRISERVTRLQAKLKDTFQSINRKAALGNYSREEAREMRRVIRESRLKVRAGTSVM